MSLSDRIRNARRRSNLTQVQLAKICGISQSALSDLESGKSKSLRGKTLLSMAAALGQSPEWLAGDSEKADAFNPRSPVEEGLLVDFRKLTAAEKKIVLRMMRALVIDR